MTPLFVTTVAGSAAAASLLETWIDEGQRHAWFLAETARA
jgi:hypothetical protein